VFRLLTSVAVVWCLVSPASARAESASSLVVVVAADPGGPVARRLTLDLESLGIDVLVFKTTAENSKGHASLEKSARSVGAIAAVRIVDDGKRTEVWVADRITGKTVIRELVGPETADVNPEEIALAAIELFRASLLEVHSGAPRHGDAELTPEAHELSRTGAPPVSVVTQSAPLMASLDAGFAIDPGLRGIGPSLQGQFGGSLLLKGPLGVRIFASMPILPEERTFPEGRAQLSAKMAGLGLTYFTPRSDAPLVPSVGAGILGALIEAVGQATTPGLSSRVESDVLVGAWAQGGVGIRITGGVRLRLDATAIVLAKSATVAIDGRPVGHWGAPGILASIGVEALIRQQGNQN
jgi:hypothetical protein